MSLFYIGNYAFATDENGGLTDAVVEESYTKIRHKSRRVGRNRYVSGEAYNVCYMKVRFDNGDIKELQIDCNQYRELQKGDTIPLYISDGLLGVPVIKFNHVTKYTRKNSYRDQFKKISFE